MRIRYRTRDASSRLDPANDNIIQKELSYLHAKSSPSVRVRVRAHIDNACHPSAPARALLAPSCIGECIIRSPRPPQNDTTLQKSSMIALPQPLARSLTKKCKTIKVLKIRMWNSPTNSSLRQTPRSLELASELRIHTCHPKS